MLESLIALVKRVSGFVDRHFIKFALLFLLGEAALNWFIIRYVPYTEIDWVAYMQEVEGYLSGDWNYPNLRGQTGPLVYPAGFVYLYTVLRWLTNNGTSIRRAQYIFMLLYLAVQATVFGVYSFYRRRGRRLIPAVVVFSVLCLSKRIHSIFVLRCFNDCFAMLFMYLATLAFISDFWSLGLAVFSVGLSIKMNVMLFLPGILVLLCQRFGFVKGVLLRVPIVPVIQAILGIPFLVENWRGYLNKSFELGRKFFHIWTVNLKFLPEEIFLNETLHKALLLGTAGSMLLFAWFKWTKHDKIRDLLFGKSNPLKLASWHVIQVLFTCNFLGMVFSRTIHFQFYVWYFHTLPLIAWNTPLPGIIGVGLLLGIEYVFNVFPSNYNSSLALTIIHLVLFLASIFSENRNPCSRLPASTEVCDDPPKDK